MVCFVSRTFFFPRELEACNSTMTRPPQPRARRASRCAGGREGDRKGARCARPTPWPGPRDAIRREVAGAIERWRHPVAGKRKGEGGRECRKRGENSCGAVCWGTGRTTSGRRRKGFEGGKRERRKERKNKRTLAGTGSGLWGAGKAAGEPAVVRETREAGGRRGKKGKRHVKSSLAKKRFDEKRTDEKRGSYRERRMMGTKVGEE